MKVLVQVYKIRTEKINVEVDIEDIPFNINRRKIMA